MGCCESTEQDEFDEPSERDALIGGNSTGSDRGGPSHHPNNQTVGQQKSDEQSALSRILQQTSNNLIDISAQALSADMTEETEAQYRSKQYASKINNVRVSSPSRIGSGRSNPYNILSQPAIPPSDLDLVVQAAQKTPQCMSKVAIHHKEDLVVPFGVP